MVLNPSDNDYCQFGVPEDLEILCPTEYFSTGSQLRLEAKVVF